MASPLEKHSPSLPQEKESLDADISKLNAQLQENTTSTAFFTSNMAQLQHGISALQSKQPQPLNPVQDRNEVLAPQHNIQDAQASGFHGDIERDDDDPWDYMLWLVDAGLMVLLLAFAVYITPVVEEFVEMVQGSDDDYLDWVIGASIGVLILVL